MTICLFYVMFFSYDDETWTFYMCATSYLDLTSSYLTKYIKCCPSCGLLVTVSQVEASQVIDDN